MTNLSVFSFNSNDVRTFADDHNEMWFCANDVCKVLGYSNPAKSIKDHCKEKGITNRYTPTSGGEQEMTYINEPNLYRLIIKSRKPEAEAFEAHVMEVILPTIRKTGTYSAPERKTKQTFIGGLTGDQQDAIKALVKARAEETDDKRKQAVNSRKIWSAVKNKFIDTVAGDYTYKKIAPEHYTSIVSLISRLPLEGEFIAATDAPKAIEAPTIPEGMVLVRKDLLEETNNMIKMIDERFSLVEQAEREIQHSFNVLSVITSGYMKQANDAIREARYRLIDPIKHAKSYSGLMVN